MSVSLLASRPFGFWLGYGKFGKLKGNETDSTNCPYFGHAPRLLPVREAVPGDGAQPAGGGRTGGVREGGGRYSGAGGGPGDPLRRRLRLGQAGDARDHRLPQADGPHHARLEYPLPGRRREPRDAAPQDDDGGPRVREPGERLSRPRLRDRLPPDRGRGHGGGRDAGAARRGGDDRRRDAGARRGHQHPGHARAGAEPGGAAARDGRGEPAHGDAGGRLRLHRARPLPRVPQTQGELLLRRGDRAVQLRRGKVRARIRDRQVRERQYLRGTRAHRGASDGRSTLHPSPKPRRPGADGGDPGAHHSGRSGRGDRAPQGLRRQARGGERDRPRPSARPATPQPELQPGDPRRRASRNWQRRPGLGGVRPPGGGVRGVREGTQGEWGAREGVRRGVPAERSRVPGAGRERGAGGRRVNLERLYVENYKQLRDPVELHPPEGAIGVVGPNGAGKSTLFETILWAFFGSKGAGPRFANESIPWSGGSTKDPTVVEVTLTTGNGPYTVRRQLKSNATSAEALDAGGKTVVTGAADVTRWVEEVLLGMDRTAFEATFYAKQKELRFFAHDDGISRVRRISKMLGISGVEVAQQFLRADRNELRSEVRAIEARLAEADLESLQGELEGAKAEFRRLEEELEKISNEYEEAESELKGAREARAALDAAYREHTRLIGELRDAESERQRAEDRAQEAEKDLEELAKAKEELEALEPELARLPELEAELERLEGDRRRSESRDQARRDLRQAQSRIAAIESEVANALEELDGEDEPLPGWGALFELDGSELLAQAAVVLEGATGELSRAEERYEALRELASCYGAYRLAEEEVREARARHEEALAESERLAGELEEVAASHRGRAAADEREAKNVDKAREAIESGAEDHCPTCERPFEDGELFEISDTLGRQAASIRRRAARETEKAEKLSAAAAATAERLQKVSAKLGRWRELREALARAEDRADDRFETLKLADEHRHELEGQIEGTVPPGEGDIEEARARCERLRELRDARVGVASYAREHTELVGRAAELSAELEELAGVSYDPETHRERKEEKARLDESRGRAAELERRLESRPEIEAALEDARRRAGEAEEKAKDSRLGISALGFDEAAYERATERVVAAEEKVNGLRDAREHLGGEWKDADYRIERVGAELERLDSDRKLANRKASEAARMDEMDALFTRFFKSLTARARPMLEAEASAFIRELTDGCYERMEFDENYRVKLLDRFDDSYAIDRFSGGEADVASLSARVALSKIIAARGGDATLGFLILDEVFGSLDASRRNNVLLALERLKRSFGQIFIISHVAEVQESALVDEVWMLEEDEDGKSTVRRVEHNLITPVELGSPER